MIPNKITDRHKMTYWPSDSFSYFFFFGGGHKNIIIRSIQHPYNHLFPQRMWLILFFIQWCTRRKQEIGKWLHPPITYEAGIELKDAENSQYVINDSFEMLDFNFPCQNSLAIAVAKLFYDEIRIQNGHSECGHRWVQCKEMFLSLSCQ